jgi:hypothetical protein
MLFLLILFHLMPEKYIEAAKIMTLQVLTFSNHHYLAAYLKSHKPWSEMASFKTRINKEFRTACSMNVWKDEIKYFKNFWTYRKHKVMFAKENGIYSQLSFSPCSNMWFKCNILSIWVGCCRRLAAAVSRTEGLKQNTWLLIDRKPS